MPSFTVSDLPILPLLRYFFCFIEFISLILLEPFLIEYIFSSVFVMAEPPESNGSWPHPRNNPWFVPKLPTKVLSDGHPNVDLSNLSRPWENSEVQNFNFLQKNKSHFYLCFIFSKDKINLTFHSVEIYSHIFDDKLNFICF